MKTLKGIKIKLYPNEEQKDKIETNIHLRRFVKNQMLAMQQERHTNNGKYVSKFGMIYCLKVLKSEYPFLRLAESTCLEYACADLDQAYQRFLKGKNKKPIFESRKRPHNSYKSKCINHNIQVVDNHYIKLPKLGVVKAYGLHRVQGKIKSAVIKKDSTSAYLATIQVETEVDTLPKTGAAVGIDLGITDLAIQSDGFKLKNKQYERSLAKKKRVWERKLARRRTLALKKIEQAKEAGVEMKLSEFKNYQKAKQMVAKYNRKIANQRAYYLHKYTTELVSEFDTIVVEDLKIKNLLKNHRLARSITDASWRKIVDMLEYKCEWYGKELIKVNPAYTSQMCSSCGIVDGKKALHIRQWQCKSCGKELDRDVNAAQNILNKAFA